MLVKELISIKMGSCIFSRVISFLAILTLANSESLSTQDLIWRTFPIPLEPLKPYGGSFRTLDVCIPFEGFKRIGDCVERCRCKHETSSILRGYFMESSEYCLITVKDFLCYENMTRIECIDNGIIAPNNWCYTHQAVRI